MSFKYKYFILLIFIFIFLLLSYSMAFKKTINIRSNYKEIFNKINNSSIDNTVIIEKKNKLKKLEDLIGKNYKGIEFHEQVLQIISNYCQKKNIKLTEYPGVHEFQNKDYIIQTSTVVLQADYISLLKLIYFIEHSNNIGRITSVIYFKERNNRTRTNVLKLKFFIQNIKKINNETSPEKNRGRL